MSLSGGGEPELWILCLESSRGRRECLHLSRLVPEARRWGGGEGPGGGGERAGEHCGLGSPVGLCRTTKRKGLSMMISSGAIRAETMMAKREGTRF